MKKKTIIGLIIPIAFCIINFGVFKVPFNLIETIMITLISFISLYNYDKNNDYLNPVVYFPVLYFVLYWIGDFDFGLGYTPPTNTMWIYYLIGLLGFYLGVFIISKFKNNRKDKTSNEENAEDYLKGDTRLVFSTIYLFCVFCKVLVFSKYGIPLLVNNVDAVRQTLGESAGILKVISSAHTIISVYFFYDIINRKINGKRINVTSFLIILISVFISMLEVSRLLLIQMFLPMFFIYITKYKRIKLKTIVKTMVVLLFLISGIKFFRNILENPQYLGYILNTRSDSLFVNIFLSGFNSFRVAIEDFRLLIEVVPAHSSYTYGSMFFNSILSVLPGKQIVMGYYVMELLDMSFDGLGAATTILGMFYLDGGPILIFFGMMLFSMFIQRNYYKYIRCSNVNLYSLIGVYIMYYSIFTLRTNVMPTIEPLLGMFYYLAFSYIARITKKNRGGFSEKKHLNC